MFKVSNLVVKTTFQVCLNGGTCIANDTTGDSSCECTPEYIGDHCENGIILLKCYLKPVNQSK